jgi:hypothetical protein
MTHSAMPRGLMLLGTISDRDGLPNPFVSKTTIEEAERAVTLKPVPSRLSLLRIYLNVLNSGHFAFCGVLGFSP